MDLEVIHAAENRLFFMVHFVKVKGVDFDRVLHVVGQFKARDG